MSISPALGRQKIATNKRERERERERELINGLLVDLSKDTIEENESCVIVTQQCIFPCQCQMLPNPCQQ